MPGVMVATKTRVYNPSTHQKTVHMRKLRNTSTSDSITAGPAEQSRVSVYTMNLVQVLVHICSSAARKPFIYKDLMFLAWYYSRPMQLSDFDYELPEELIAQLPVKQRSGSRLLLLEAGEQVKLQDMLFTDLPSLLQPGDLLVFNDTRVMQARLFGRKSSGGKLEILIYSLRKRCNSHCVFRIF